MRIINFFTLLTLIICLSCNKEGENTGTSDLKLELVAVTNATAQSSESSAVKVIAVLDIKSYDAKTGEVLFNNRLPDYLGEWKGDGYKVKVYTNKNSPLFTVNFATSSFSHLYNQPVLYYSLVDKDQKERAPIEKHKWYMLSGYPYGKVITAETITNAEQLENFKKIESNWNLFVAELKRTKKYIN